jgi:hypothetical protein
MRNTRVFVSSPGDASRGRKGVVRVIERLNAAFAGYAASEPVLRDKRLADEDGNPILHKSFSSR